MVLVAALVFVFGWKILTFAENNPEVAIFDGAEFLMHRQMQLGMKGEPNLPFDADEPQIVRPLAIEVSPAVVDETGTEANTADGGNG